MRGGVLCVLTAACGNTIASSPAASGPAGSSPAAEHQVATVPSPPLTAEAFGQRLLQPGTQAAAVIDWEASDRIEAMRTAESGTPRGREARVAALRRALALPEGCTPTFEAADGYELLAFPPAMTTHTDSQAAAIDAGLDVLRSGTELTALCPTSTFAALPAEPDSPGSAPAFVLSIRRAEIHNGGTWRVQAWARLSGAWQGAYPE